MSTMQIITDIKIPEGQSLSNAVDCSAGRVARITTPAGWDNALLTFQISTDGQGFSDLYYSDGREYSVVCMPHRGIIINQADWLPGLWLKFRSGSSDQPRNQTAEREFAIALLVEDTP